MHIRPNAKDIFQVFWPTTDRWLANRKSFAILELLSQLKTKENHVINDTHWPYKTNTDFFVTLSKSFKVIKNNNSFSSHQLYALYAVHTFHQPQAPGQVIATKSNQQTNICRLRKYKSFTILLSLLNHHIVKMHCKSTVIWFLAFLIFLKVKLNTFYITLFH